MKKSSIKIHKVNSHGVDLNNAPIVQQSKVENTCNICGHVSKYTRDIKKHIKIVHEKNLDYIYKYKYCNKKFSNRGNLNTHELINNQGQSVPQIVSHPSSELELMSNFQLISCPNSYPSPHTVNTKYMYI